VWFTEKHLQGEWKWEARTRIEQSERGIELSFDRDLVIVPTTAFSGEYDQALFVEQGGSSQQSRR
jgi:hypothetical protein